MQQSEVHQALGGAANDEALVRHFLAVWPVVESILEAFSQATELPIFTYLNGIRVFQSSRETMPRFCSLMLSSPDTEALCVNDGRRRAAKLEREIEPGIQLCHAGLRNGRCEIDAGVGNLVILFGSKKSVEAEAVARRAEVIESTRLRRPELAAELAQAADPAPDEKVIIDSHDVRLMGAITDILQRLLSATVGFRSLTINMAHELSVMMLQLGLQVDLISRIIDRHKGSSDAQRLVAQLSRIQHLVFTQSRLGLYIVRNFLSHSSETRYEEVVKPDFREIDIQAILGEMIELHQPSAEKKQVAFETSKLAQLPQVMGAEMEIQRLFHNILNNAIKYSYHSIPAAQRTIRIWSKVPYDPGFHQKRFSIVFENYGLGLAKEEQGEVFRPGFRGKQAIAEVPIGAGIGLSEAHKIMKVHAGEIKFNSKELFEDGSGEPTYKTSVELIFPYPVEFRRAQRKMKQ